MSDIDQPIPVEENSERPITSGAQGNVILVGVTGSGKSTSGWLLARLIGYGFCDVDQLIESRARKTIAAIFSGAGETAFRDMEHEAIANLKRIRHHVIAVGGGAIESDANFKLLSSIGTLVWINTPAQEVARRLLMKPDEIRKRPLIADLVNIADRDQRSKELVERIETLISQRQPRFQEAQLVLQNAHSTTETSAHLLKQLLLSEGVLRR